MEDLCKSHIRDKAKHEIADSLQKLLASKENAYTNGVPMSQQDEYKEALEKQVERVTVFLGFGFV